MSHDTSKHDRLRFELGQTVATPGALTAIHQAGQSLLHVLSRHAACDWGDIDDDDQQLNNKALTDGSRLFSAYTLRSGDRIWVITEAADDHGHRTVTTVLLPDEY
jgi:hypothetical protein